MSSPRPLVSERLVLLPATAAVVRADLEGSSELSEALGVAVPAEWPPEHHDEAALRWTLARIEDPDVPAGWHLHYVGALGREGRPTRLVGTAGFKGPPSEGAVEIGYSILPGERRRGFATEAVRRLVHHAFGDIRVERVVAETLPDLRASIGVLEKCGFQPVAGPDPSILRYEVIRGRWERCRCLD